MKRSALASSALAWFVVFFLTVGGMQTGTFAWESVFFDC